MNWKYPGCIAVGIATGIVAASIFHRDGRPEIQAGTIAAGPVANSAKDDMVTLRADYERQIADLRSQLEVARLQAAKTTSASSPAPLTMLDAMKREQGKRQARLAAARQRETDALLAAGFTNDRIEWIRKRELELAADYRRKEDQLKQQGKADVNVMLAHNTDSDIDLRYELGDDEYARYRQATGRSTGMKIEEVTSGGRGESAGLRIDDEIIAYNGVRVFNAGELNARIVKYKASGASIPVDVMRDGQKIRLNVEMGDLRIRAPFPVPTMQEQERLEKVLDVMTLEAATRQGANNR